MPVMNGITLIRELRTIPEYQRVRILMLTTESSDAMKHQGRAAGAPGWLVKSFDPARLLEVVQKVIRQLAKTRSDTESDGEVPDAFSPGRPHLL